MSTFLTWSEIKQTARLYFAPLHFLARLPWVYAKFLCENGYLGK